MRHEVLPPGVHGPSLRWYRPSGLAYLAVRSTWRFWITGRHLWGKGDNATFLHDATVDYRGAPVERLSRARWRRLAWRWSTTGIPALLWLYRPWLAYTYLTLAAAAGGWAAYRAVAAWWPAREVRRDFVVPTWQVVCRVVGEKYSRRAAVRSIQLPAGFGLETEAEADLVVRIHLPAVPLDEGVKKRIATSAGERLGIKDPVAAWMVRGARAYVDLSPRKLPPAKLVYAEVRQLVLDASPSKPLVGLAAGRVPVYADLDNDGPHMGVSAGTGAGKSTLMRLVLSRRMAAGVGVICCDYKVISHQWLRRIAAEDPHRAVYVTDEPEISETILSVFAEFTRRREILKTRPEELASFRKVDLVVEELNSTADLLRRWWREERKRLMQEAKDLGEDVSAADFPTVPEAVDALGVLVQAGRELGIHVHLLGQRLDASAISPRGGGAIRESLSNRFLSRYTKKAWMMLADSVPFQAFPGGPAGVWAAIHGGEVSFLRVPFTTNDEAYALAMSGEVPAGPVLGGARLIPARDQKRLVTLPEAWESIRGCPSLPALQKAVQRARPPVLGKRGNADLFDLRALEALYDAPALIR